MMDEKIRVSKHYISKFNGECLNNIKIQGDCYYPIYSLINLFISTSNPKDFLKKNLKRDELFKCVYEEIIRYDLDIKKTAMINAQGFNIVISFIANKSLDPLKHYIDQQVEPIDALDNILAYIVQEINTSL